MAMVSRNVPPWAAVMTIMPAAGGPSSTTFQSSGEKAAWFVISGSRVPGLPGHVEDLAVPGRGASSGEGESTRSQSNASLIIPPVCGKATPPSTSERLLQPPAARCYDQRDYLLGQKGLSTVTDEGDRLD